MTPTGGERRPGPSRREDGFRALGTAILAVLVATGVLLLLPRGCGGSLRTADARIQSLLHDALRDGLQLELPGHEEPLKGARVRLALPAVHVVDEDHAVAVITLDFTGTFSETRVSSLGYERIPFVRDGRGRWTAPDGYAPRLTAAVAALEARRAALEAGAPERLDALATEAAPPSGELFRVRALLSLKERRVRSERWLLRSERDRVEVAEDYRIDGVLPERPVHEKGMRNLTLVPSDAGLQFSPPLM